MKSTQETITDFLEREAKLAGLHLMDSKVWNNTGTWRLVNSGNQTFELDYNFQHDYVILGGFRGLMFNYQGEYHLILKRIKRFITSAFYISTVPRENNHDKG